MLSVLQSGAVGDSENKWETEALRSAVKMRTLEVQPLTVKGQRRGHRVSGEDRGSVGRTQGQWGGHGVSGEDTVREGHDSSGAMAWVDAYRRYEVMCTA